MSARMEQVLDIAHSKRVIIAAKLAEGRTLDSIREELIATGQSAATVSYELKRAEKDPFVQAMLKLHQRIAKRDWIFDNYRRLDALRRDRAVPIVRDIDPARFVDEFYCTNRPVILTGLVEHWRALDKWNLDYLDQQVGDAHVELQCNRESHPDYELFKDRHRRLTSMHEVIAAIRQVEHSNEFYLTAYNGTTNKRALQVLWSDLGDIRILAPGGGANGFFWLGPKGTLTPLHHDLTNNLLVQVMGRKRVRLIAPWEFQRVRNHIHCFSELTLDDLRGEAPHGPRQMECIIGPGDALFLPVGWWHHVEALDPSISMSFTDFPYDNDFCDTHPQLR